MKGGSWRLWSLLLFGGGGSKEERAGEEMS